MSTSRMSFQRWGSEKGLTIFIKSHHWETMIVNLVEDVKCTLQYLQVNMQEYVKCELDHVMKMKREYTYVHMYMHMHSMSVTVPYVCISIHGTVEGLKTNQVTPYQNPLTKLSQYLASFIRLALYPLFLHEWCQVPNSFLHNPSWLDYLHKKNIQ